MKSTVLSLYLLVLYIQNQEIEVFTIMFCRLWRKFEIFIQKPVAILTNETLRSVKPRKNGLLKTAHCSESHQRFKVVKISLIG